MSTLVVLPISYIYFDFFFQKESLPVEASGIVCSVVILFFFITLLYLFLLCWKGRMTKVVGGIAVGVYILFIAVSLAFTYDAVKCPV